MPRFLASLLKTLAFLNILLGIVATVFTLGYLLILGLIFIGIGILLYIFDYFVSKLNNHRKYWIGQSALSLAYLVFLFVSYMEWQKHNEIIVHKGLQGEIGIIFGIKGYPILPETEFWKKRILLPADGILITSTKSEDIPNTFQFKYADGAEVNFSYMHFSHHEDYSCIASNGNVRFYSFQIGNNNTNQFQEKLAELCNLINQGKLTSRYTSAYSPIVTGVPKTYLHLQDRNLKALPDNVANIKVKEVILTGNQFTDFPEPILQMEHLESLLIGHNPISDIPQSIYQLKHLKSLYLNNTNVKNISTDLSGLDSLEHLSFSGNELETLPEQVKNLPNLKWLQIDDNEFKDLSFVDKRLHKLETLYLYTNKIERISPETTHLYNLKELLIFDNQIDSIPKNIAELKSLEKLEIWDNPITYISPKISEVKNLKYLMLDDDNLSMKDKKNLRVWLPNTEIKFRTRASK